MIGTAPSQGPFHVFHSNRVIEIHSKDFGTVVKWTGFDGTDFKHERNLANACLLAAAPELLEALQLVRMSAGWQALSNESRSVITDAITKATKGQP